MSMQHTKNVLTVEELPLKYDFQEVSHEVAFSNLYLCNYAPHLNTQ